jgi:hypothetical protein
MCQNTTLDNYNKYIVMKCYHTDEDFTTMSIQRLFTARTKNIFQKRYSRRGITVNRTKVGNMQKARNNKFTKIQLPDGISYQI